MQQEIIDVLLKKAKGYTYDEQQDEYTVREDGEMVLIRRKIAKKYSLPDSGALRMYLDICGEREIETYTDEELFNARESLRKEFFEYMKEEYDKNLSKKEEQEENTDNSPAAPSDSNDFCDAPDTPFADGNAPCDAPDISSQSDEQKEDEENFKAVNYSSLRPFARTAFCATRSSVCTDNKTPTEIPMYSQVRGSPFI